MQFEHQGCPKSQRSFTFFLKEDTLEASRYLKFHTGLLTIAKSGTTTMLGLELKAATQKSQSPKPDVLKPKNSRALQGSFW